MATTYYSVVETREGKVEVVSYLAKTLREEKGIARRENRELFETYTDHDEAQRHAKELRSVIEIECRR